MRGPSEFIFFHKAPSTECPSDGAAIGNRHRQLPMDLRLLITAELGRKREKSRNLPFGTSFWFRHFGRKHEAGTHSSRAVGVLFRAPPSLNDFDLRSYPLITESSSFGTGGDPHWSGSSAGQELLWCTTSPGIRAPLCCKSSHAQQRSSERAPLGTFSQGNSVQRMASPKLTFQSAALPAPLSRGRSVAHLLLPGSGMASKGQSLCTASCHPPQSRIPVQEQLSLPQHRVFRQLRTGEERPLPSVHCLWHLIYT